MSLRATFDAKVVVPHKARFRGRPGLRAASLAAAGRRTSGDEDPRARRVHRAVGAPGVPAGTRDAR